MTACFSDLPLQVVRLIMQHADEKWRPILAHVSRGFRDAVLDLQALQAPADVEDDESEEDSMWITAEAIVASVPMLEWALGQGCPRSPKLIVAAARRGHLEVLKRAIEALGMSSSKYLTRAGCEAAAGGHLAIVQHLAAYLGASIVNEDMFAAAANAGRIDIMDWLMHHGCRIRPTVCMEAAAEEQFGAIRWLSECGIPLESFSGAMGERRLGVPVAWAAAKAGDLALLEWAVSEGAIFNADTAWGAAAGGHLEALQWCVRQGVYPDEQAISAAASNGHLEAFQWLVEQGYPWDKDMTCLEAVEGGNVEVLKIARQHGCPFEGDELVVAAGTGDLAMLDWLANHGFPLEDNWYQQLYAQACSSKREGVKQWIKRRLTVPEEIAWVEDADRRMSRFAHGGDDSDEWETASSDDEFV